MFGISELAILLIPARNAGKAARTLKSETKAMKAESSGGEQQPAPFIVQAQPGDRVRTRAGDRPGNGSIRT